MTRPPLRIVVTDANILINLMLVGRLDLCWNLPGYEFIVPEHVRTEIVRPEQREPLETAITDGNLKVESITELKGLVLFADLAERMGKGEAACIAIAESHGWSIASDEKGRFRKEAVARIGAKGLMDTPGIFVLGIQAGLLTIVEADQAKLSLETQRFRMPFASFKDVLPG